MSHLPDALVMYALAALSFVLGFAALFMQKNYIDSRSNQVTEIELPLVGKLKTNYPALVFVMVGFALAVVVWMNPRDLGEEEWTITGSMKLPESEKVKWEEGSIVVLPRGFQGAPEKTGTFTISGHIPKGKKFEDVASTIMYSHPDVSGHIDVLQEYRKYVARDPTTLLKNADNRIRDYSSMDFDVFNK